MSATQVMTGPEPRWRSIAEAGVIVSVVGVVSLLVVPLPAMALDLLLAISIATSLVVLLVSLNTTDPLDFSVFPTILLLFTLYRLALNVSSTRLILGDAHAGRVIEAFGAFVVGGNYAVGIVVFLILVAINFIVITKGAGRVAEVAARFTLDAMPGRQMSIDADLGAGLIDDDEARRQREKISREADFYGAMDGAAKFVRGDAIAGLLITAINILGGLFVGVVQRGMPAGRALTEYTLLTVGDGLVTQIPALIVSTAAGIMVTHSAGQLRVGAAVLRQLGRHPRPLWVAAGFLASMGLVPGLPALPFLVLAGATGALAHGVRVQNETEEEAVRAAAEFHRRDEEAIPLEDPMHDLLQIDPVELQIGFGLISLVDAEQGGDLMERIRLLRKQAAQELGILIPPIRIRDDARLDASEYSVRVRGTEVARWKLLPRHVLALDAGGVIEPVDGVATKDPSFGMPARWILPANRAEAEARGFVVVEAPTVVATHLMETLKASGAELLGRQDVQDMLDRLKETHPALVEDVVPGRVGLAVVHRVLQRLLKERIPIRDLVTVLESLADAADRTQDLEALCEHVRGSLVNVIGELYADENGDVHGIVLGPRLEAALMQFFSPRAGRAESLIRPDALTTVLRRIDALTRENAVEGALPPVVTPPGLRVGVRRLLEPVLPAVPVISLSELPTNVTLTTIAVWEMDHES